MRRCVNILHGQARALQVFEGGIPSKNDGGGPLVDLLWTTPCAIQSHRLHIRLKETTTASDGLMRDLQ